MSSPTIWSFSYGQSIFPHSIKKKIKTPCYTSEANRSLKLQNFQLQSLNPEVCCWVWGLGKELEEANATRGHGPVQGSLREDSGGRLTRRKTKRSCLRCGEVGSGSSSAKRSPLTPTCQHSSATQCPPHPCQSGHLPLGLFYPESIHSLFQCLLLILGFCFFLFISSYISRAKFWKYWWVFQLGLVCIPSMKNISCIHSLLSFQLPFIWLLWKKQN